MTKKEKFKIKTKVQFKIKNQTTLIYIYLVTTNCLAYLHIYVIITYIPYLCRYDIYPFT